MKRLTHRMGRSRPCAGRGDLGLAGGMVSSLERSGREAIGPAAIERGGSVPVPPSPRGVRRGRTAGLQRGRGWRDPATGGASAIESAGARGARRLERPHRRHRPGKTPTTDSSFTEPFSPRTRSPPTTASRSPPPPAPSSTSPASCRSTSYSRPSTRPSACDSTARSQTGHPTKRARKTSARSRHQPTPEGTSRPASPPSSMTAVSRRPRPTSSLREWRSTSRGRKRRRLSSSTAGSTTAPAPRFERDRRRDRVLRRGRVEAAAGYLARPG